MPYGKYRLRDSNRQKRMTNAYKRYMRLCGEVVIIKEADPEKLKAAKEKQRQRRKNKPIKNMQIETGKGNIWRNRNDNNG